VTDLSVTGIAEVGDGQYCPLGRRIRRASLLSWMPPPHGAVFQGSTGNINVAINLMRAAA